MFRAVQELLSLDARLLTAGLGRPATPQETRPLRQLLGQLSRRAEHQEVATQVLASFTRHWSASDTDVARLGQYLRGLGLLSPAWTALNVSPEQAARIPDSEFYCYDHLGAGRVTTEVMVSGRLEVRPGHAPCPYWSAENTLGRAFADGHCSLLGVSDHDRDDREGGAEHSTGRLLWDQVRVCPPVLQQVPASAGQQGPMRSPEAFVRRFIAAEYRVWRACYRVRSTPRFEAIRRGLAAAFYAFEATVAIDRPTLPDAAWFAGAAKEDLALTVPRPLLRLEALNLGGRLIFAADTGSTDPGTYVGGSPVFERLLIEGEAGSERVVAVYRLDPEGEWAHRQGEVFTLPFPEALEATGWEVGVLDTDG